MVPSSDGKSITVQVNDLAQGPPLDVTVDPAEGATFQSTQLAYSPGSQRYEGQVSLGGVGLGTGRVQVSGGMLPSRINSDYNLQMVQAITTNHLYSEDGNFELHIPPNGVPADGYSTVLPTGYVPGPLPADRQAIGSAYEVRLSGALTELEKDGLVRLHYHPKVMGVYTDTTIYYWEPNAKQWQPLGGEASEVDNALSIPARRLGIYALMGVQIAGGIGEDRVYLPVIVK
jgi:hypothetical protein